MQDHHIEERFGTIALNNDYITKAQLHVAMFIQINEDLGGKPHRLIGQILLEKRQITPEQISTVLIQMGLPRNILNCAWNNRSTHND